MNALTTESLMCSATKSKVNTYFTSTQKQEFMISKCASSNGQGSHQSCKCHCCSSLHSSYPQDVSLCLPHNLNQWTLMADWNSLTFIISKVFCLPHQKSKKNIDNSHAIKMLNLVWNLTGGLQNKKEPECRHWRRGVWCYTLQADGRHCGLQSPQTVLNCHRNKTTEETFWSVHVKYQDLACWKAGETRLIQQCGF